VAPRCGLELKPALALGSWLAFRSEGDQALVMGDLVLTADDVSPVMRKLAGEGIEVTASVVSSIARPVMPRVA
jgi:hypothetical protein